MSDATQAQISPSHQLSSLILGGLILGIACGLFFGEYCAPLSVVGDAFVGLLRMTVLPFIVVSLVANFGRLSLRQIRRLALVGGCFLLLLWAIGLVTVFMLPFSFPQWKAGSFFSSTLTDPAPNTDLLKIFIPSNFFAALAENHVPAVVLLSIFVGLALSGLDNRQLLIDQLDVLAKALIRVTGFVTRLTPLGIFAIAASTAGTMSFDEIGRLKAYLLAYTAGALLLTFVVLPALVVSLTPFKYGEVIGVTKNALITVFATGKLIIVLPMLIAETERLFQRSGHGIASEAGEPDDGGAAAPAVDLLYPLAYPFPHVGKLLGMLFIPFAAWFLGNAMSVYEYPVFLATGLFAYFGGPILATPFLLDQAQLPHDMFQLFLLSGVWCERLGDSVGAMHLVVLTILTTCALTGRLRVRWGALLRTAAITVALAAAILITLRYGIQTWVGDAVNREQVISSLQLLEEPVESRLLTEAVPNPAPLEPGEALLERVRRRGVLRVGYNQDKLPFAYFNIHGELVGFDINMAHYLARDLGVTLEFVPFQRSTLAQQMDNDDFDIVMAGLVGTLERAEAMQMSEPYMDVTLSLVVPDYRVRDFKAYSSMRELDELKIGFVDLSQGFVDRLRRFLPNAELVELPTNRAFFAHAHKELDALLISAESGAAFTLFYPEFEVVVPDGPRVSLPLVYAIGARDEEMGDFIDHWIELRTADGTAQDNYDHWILGKSQQAKEPRWSVLRNVLGWSQ